MIERHDITSPEQWRGLRQADMTASVVGALFGVHEYQTAYGLYMLKSGRIEDDPEESEAMQRGRLLEPVAVELLREKHPEWEITRPGVYLRDPDHRLGATPDCFADCPKRGLGVVQIKSVEASIFYSKWRDAETREITPPDWISIQAIIEASLAGATWAAVAPLVVSHGLTMPLVEVPIHARIVEQARAKSLQFWQMVADGREPPPDYARDGDVLSRLYAQDDGGHVDLSSDNELPVLAAERDTLSDEIKVRSDRLDQIKNVFKAKIGDKASASLADGRVVTNKTTHRKAYEVKATSYRALRFGSPKNSFAAGIGTEGPF